MKLVAPIQHKGKRVPIRLPERKEKKIERTKLIIKLDKCSDEQYISANVRMVKKDQTVELAIYSKKINMQKIELHLQKIL